MSNSIENGKGEVRVTTEPMSRPVNYRTGSGGNLVDTIESTGVLVPINLELR